MSKSEVGTIISGRYELLRKLGEGGMGSVYKAKHLALNKLFAIKILDSHAQDSDFHLRFDREAKASSLLNHPSLVSISDYGLTELEEPFLVMELIDGISLAREIEKFGPIRSHRAVNLFLQMTQALEYAHGVGIVHRDLKPANIMLLNSGTENEKIKIIDFGIAKMVAVDVSEFKTAKNALIGSPFYMSPEQCQGFKVDERTDIYSLGCVMYECLTAKPPFVGESFYETISLHVSAEPEAFSADLRVPPLLETIISKALAKSPEDRFQTMTDLKAALDGLSSQLTETQPLSSGFAWSRKKAVVFAVSVLCVAVLGVFGVNRYIAGPRGAYSSESTTLKGTEGLYVPGEYESANVNEMLRRFGELPVLSESDLGRSETGMLTLCKSYLAAGDDKRALACFRLAVRKYPQSILGYKMLLDSLFEKGETNFARNESDLHYISQAKLFDDVVLVFYRNASPYYANRAACEKILGDNREAMKDYQRAIRTLPAGANNSRDKARLEISLAESCASLGQFGRAIKLCSDNESFENPKSFEIEVMRYLVTDNFHKVVEVTNKSLKAQRSDFSDEQTFKKFMVGQYRNKGVALFELNRKGEALKCFEAARPFVATDKEVLETNYQIHRISGH